MFCLFLKCICHFLTIFSSRFHLWTRWCSYSGLDPELSVLMGLVEIYFPPPPTSGSPRYPRMQHRDSREFAEQDGLWCGGSLKMVGGSFPEQNLATYFHLHLCITSTPFQKFLTLTCSQVFPLPKPFQKASEAAFLTQIFSCHLFLWSPLLSTANLVLNIFIFLFFCYWHCWSFPFMSSSEILAAFRAFLESRPLVNPYILLAIPWLLHYPSMLKITNILAPSTSLCGLCHCCNPFGAMLRHIYMPRP